MEVAICTAIFGGYDELKQPAVVEDVPYICFTDDPELTSDLWEIRTLPTEYTDPRMKAVQCKLLLHRYIEQDAAIWVDGHIEILREVVPLSVAMLEHHSIAAPQHRHRDCFYAEVREVLRLHKAHPSEQAVLEQIKAYGEEEYPYFNGLAEVHALVRRFTSSTILFCEEWYRECTTRSSRTQLSFNYVSWKFSIPYQVIPLPVAALYFKWHRHLRR